MAPPKAETIVSGEKNFGFCEAKFAMNSRKKFFQWLRALLGDYSPLGKAKKKFSFTYLQNEKMRYNIHRK